MKNISTYKVRIITAIGSAILFSCASAYAEVAVIGNPNLPLNALSKSQVKQLFLEQPISLPHHAKVQVFDQASSSSAYGSFYHDFYGWSKSQVSNYWTSNKFTGQGNPPATLEGDENAIAVVEGTPGAVSYIDTSALKMARGNVKVLYPNNLSGEMPKAKVIKKPKQQPLTKVAKPISTKPAIMKSKPKKATVKVNKPKLSAMQQVMSHHEHANVTPMKVTQVQIPPSYKGDLWSHLAGQFTLQAYANRPEVRDQIQWFLKHQDQFAQSLADSKPYLAYLSSEVNQRHMPAEVALIPIIEANQENQLSTAGVWQLQVSTAQRLNIQSDWWYDGRRDLVGSTSKVLDRLNTLYTEFGSWPLAFAAYHAGEANIQLAIQNNISQHKPTDFWHLSLKKDTKDYVAKLIALVQILKYPAYYKLTLPSINGNIPFAPVALNRQMDVSEISKLASVSTDQIQMLNPDMMQWATAPNTHFTVLLPANKAQSFKAKMLASADTSQNTWRYYQVQAGDSVQSIANRYQTSADELKQINLLDSPVGAGQGILIPIAAAPEVTQTESQSIKRQTPQMKVITSTSNSSSDTQLRSVLSKISASRS